MTSTYTDSKGNAVPIASMVYNHLKSAHAKAVKVEDLAREVDPDHRDEQRLAEIEAMRLEIERRDAAYAEGQADAIDAGEGFGPR
jgi:hypothetical protein